MPEEVVHKVVSFLTGENQTSLYELYASGTRRDGRSRIPICGKGTAAKVKKLFENGKLQPYLDYLEDTSRHTGLHRHWKMSALMIG